MVLLHQATRGQQGRVAVARPPTASATTARPWSKSATSCASSAPSPPSTTSASRSRPARSSACSGPTAPARPRPSACCAACCRRPAARCASPASICGRRAPRPASASATWRRSSRSTASSRSPQNLEFFAGAYGLAGQRRARAHRLGDGAVRAGAAGAACRAGSCPAATSSAWRWRPRCSTSRRSCFSTSRPAAPTRSPAASSGGASPRSPKQGVTVIVTTHFMEEAEYCDRVVILDAGQVLARGTPAEIRAPRAGRGGARADDGGCLHRHRRGGAARARPPGREERGMSDAALAASASAPPIGGRHRAGRRGGCVP